MRSDILKGYKPIKVFYYAKELENRQKAEKAEAEHRLVFEEADYDVKFRHQA